MTQPRSWREMYERIAEQIKRETGSDVGAWNARIKERGPSSAADLKAWLNEQGVDGYPAMLLGFETFGYPDYLQASADTVTGGGEIAEAPIVFHDRLMLFAPAEVMVESSGG